MGAAHAAFSHWMAGTVCLCSCQLKTALLATIIGQAKTRPGTLLYSTKDEQHNQAVALQMFLKKLRKRGASIPAKRAAPRPRVS